MARKKVVLRQLTQVPLDGVIAPERRPDRHQEQAVHDLQRAMEARGRATPVLLRRTDGHYRLVVGHLRLEAARRLGWREIDGIVVGAEADRELEVIARLQRDDYDPWELADALHHLKSTYHWTQEQLGMAIGRTRDFVANILAIKQIHPDVRRYIQGHGHGRDMTTRHLRYVARSPRSEQMRVAQRILERTLSTKELEREKRVHALHAPDTHFIKVRELRRAGSPQFPRNSKEWRRYHRQLMTDLRRIDRQEVAEQRRSQAQMTEARQRLRLVKSEANRKRRELARELRRVKKQILRLGG